MEKGMHYDLKKMSNYGAFSAVEKGIQRQEKKQYTVGRFCKKIISLFEELIEVERKKLTEKGTIPFNDNKKENKLLNISINQEMLQIIKEAKDVTNFANNVKTEEGMSYQIPLDEIGKGIFYAKITHLKELSNYAELCTINQTGHFVKKFIYGFAINNSLLQYFQDNEMQSTPFSKKYILINSEDAAKYGEETEEIKEITFVAYFVVI
jgi:hypothetical protein